VVSRRFDFFFDFSCPYAYLASTQVEGLAARTGATLVPKPVLLGGIFQARGVAQNLAGTLSPAKAKHNMEDLARWAERFDVPLNFPQGHPNKTVTALRCLLAVGEPFLPLTHRFYAAYWSEAADLSDESVIADVLSAAGHDAAAVLERARAQDIKDELRRRTDEGLAAGLFGVPGFSVDGVLYWGQDRLNQVERALGGTVSMRPSATDRSGAPAPTDLWFDYSSPFSYLASCRAPALFGDALRWRPMLLGAVFKMVDTPNVPFFAMNEAKRAWVTQDIARQADEAGVALRWPSGFPLKTVLPLRMTLLALEQAPERAPAFIAAVFAALWQDDASAEDVALLTRLADDAGLEGAALAEAARADRAKDLLRSETSAAVAAGVFGAPGIVVHGGTGPQLFWGNDRLELALDAALR
jgi:2-hydroxychromene-2-carboxylate isomerase